MKIKYATISETGPRSKNEDFFKVIDKTDDNRWLGVICDGMGGHAMGEIASKTVSEAVCNYWLRFTDVDTVVKARKACRSAAAKLDECAFARNHVQMGTTLVMASIDKNQITITHCGDSRCYFMRNGEIVHQTKDHVGNSLGWEIVTRCFFSYKPENAVPDIAQFEIKPGDRILLCSDGLYKSMSQEVLTANMRDDKSPEELLNAYSLLCEENGDDNYTGILVFIE